MAGGRDENLHHLCHYLLPDQITVATRQTRPPSLPRSQSTALRKFASSLNRQSLGGLADAIRTGTRPIVSDWTSGGAAAAWAGYEAPSRLRPEKVIEGKAEDLAAVGYCSHRGDASARRHRRPISCQKPAILTGQMHCCLRAIKNSPRG